MAINLNVIASQVPAGTCVSSWQQAMNLTAQYLQVQIPEQLGFGLFTYGSATPSVDRQEYPWFQTNPDGTPYDINTFVAGEWVGFGLSRPADPRTFEARLTLISGNPAPSTDITGTTLYLTPYRGNVISLFNGSNWQSTVVTEISIATGGLAANTNYDVFCYLDSGVLNLETVAWAGDTTRATELATQNDIYVKSGDASRRYVGTVRTTAVAGTIADSEAQRYIWNEYAPAPRRLAKKGGLTGVAFLNPPVWQFWEGNNSANIMECVLGTPTMVEVNLVTGVSTGVNVNIYPAIGDASAVAYPESIALQYIPTTAPNVSITRHLRKLFLPGKRAFAPIVASAGSSQNSVGSVVTPTFPEGYPSFTIVAPWPG